MATVKVGSFTGVKDAFSALVGEFNVKVEKAELLNAKDETVAKWQEKHPGEGHPGYIKWTLDVTDEGVENRKAWHNTSLTPEGRGMLLQMLVALGHTEDELESPDFEIDLEAEVGKPLRLKLVQDKNDETQHRVKQVLPPAESDGLLP